LVRKSQPKPSAQHSRSIAAITLRRSFWGTKRLPPSTPFALHGFCALSQFQTQKPFVYLVFMRPVFGTANPHMLQQTAHLKRRCFRFKWLIFSILQPSSGYFNIPHNIPVGLQSNLWGGARGGGRTHNLRLRRPTLYPIELRARGNRQSNAGKRLAQWK
jgi:hypothetical protein